LSGLCQIRTPGLKETLAGEDFIPTACCVALRHWRNPDMQKYAEVFPDGPATFRFFSRA
jgi:hypothetical protein